MSWWVSLLASLIPSGLTFAGVVYTNSKHNKTVTELMDYRMDILEKKQDKYNNVLERMQQAELSITLLDERQKVANHRIDDLEKKAES